MAFVDDKYNRLAKNIGSDFTTRSSVSELYLIHCSSCGYNNIHDLRRMNCGCGKPIEGILVYRKVGDTVIYDARSKKR